ncbi:hypothetical protein [Pseudoalteromonas luteoviolacea]|uniref:Uncharacterized protein n=1 Tax=Pseudoalteromonas luteoviolacea NCIMB 1942 TaxID=1365253 RepID=A0A166Y180_9GAMM|nr:hypothetical protein [Pseudoalteromonas luteoviolacea]KZN41243.1 hypothetical protein N482_20480 [Pseudoalteromonas luteoviolacea NCIMB 1942]KZX00493.1 hypothetical protein JL49_11420 [Pseudoalteromonas luteoviolacea]
MLLHKTSATPQSAYPLSRSGAAKAQSGEAFANELDNQSSVSQLSQSLRQKDLSTSNLNQSFLSQVQQTLMFNRLGVNEDKVKEIKAKMDELLSRLENGEISKEDFDKQMEMLESMMAKELKSADETEKQSNKLEHY